jgi:hypothetical protein
MPKPSPIGKRSKLSRNGHSGAFASKKLSRMPQDRRFVAGQYVESLLLVRCLCGMPPRVYGTRITCDIQMSLIYPGGLLNTARRVHHARLTFNVTDHSAEASKR